MIVSHRYRFIFIHCRKVAGSSIKATLGPILGLDDVMIGGVHESLRNGGRLTRPSKRALVHPKAWVGMGRAAARRQPRDEIINAGIKARYYGWLSKSPDHPTAEESRALFPDEWGSYYKFCFVRNPYERVLSEYFWRKKNTGVSVSFLEYLKLLQAPADPTGIVPERIDNWDMYTLDGAIAVDFVGRYETLEPDFQKVCQHLKLPVEGLSARRKVGQYKRDLASYYGPAEQELVATLYAREIDAFGYQPIA